MQPELMVGDQELIKKQYEESQKRQKEAEALAKQQAKEAAKQRLMEQVSVVVSAFVISSF